MTDFILYHTYFGTFFFLMLFYENVSTNAYCLAGSRLGRKERSKNPSNSVHEPTHQENGILSFESEWLLMPELLNEGFRLRIFFSLRPIELTAT